MTLRIKLLLALAPLAIALVVVSIVATSNVSSLGWHSEAILKDNYRSVLAAQRMKDSVEHLEHLAASVVSGASNEERPSKAEDHRRHFEDELRVQEGNVTEPGELDATQRQRNRWTTYQKEFDAFRSLRDPDQGRAFFRERLEPAFVAITDAADAILTVNLDAIVQKSERAHQVAERLNVITLAVSIAALLIGGIASTLLTSRLLAPLGLLTRTVHRIGEGDFETRVDVSGEDEIAQLAGTINAMAVRLRQYRNSSLGELLLAQQASQAAIDSLPDPVVVYDLQGGVINVNEAAEAVLGVGVKPPDELDPAVRATLERASTHVLSGKGPYQAKSFEDAIAVRTSEGTRYFSPRATPVHTESGSISGVTVLMQDVTRARLVDDLRNDLVATVAHEFRTPLTSLRLAIHMCLEQAAGPLNDRQSDLLYTAREDCDRLQSMVDELLDLARIQGGHMELHRRPTNPLMLIDSAASTYRRDAEDHHIVLQTSVAPGLQEIQVDRERIQLVLSNLLSNAIRHTPPGGSIEIGVKAQDGIVRFEVADSGAGIPAEYRQQVFGKFVRLPNSVGGGTGLGLSIAKQIVDAHGGKIGVDASVSGGAMFWFTLPTAALEAEPLVPVATA